MARIRSVHPGLWTDEAFVSLSLPARLFYIGLWNEADDFGLFEWKPMRLKMRLAPADAVDAAVILAEIEENGFIQRIERAGKSLGIVRNFRKYQRPKKPGSPLVAVDDEIRKAIGLVEEAPNGEPVPHQSPTGSRKSPQMEEGGGVGKGNGEKPNGFSERASAQKPRGWVSPRKVTDAVKDLNQELDERDERRSEDREQLSGGAVLQLPAVRTG